MPFDAGNASESANVPMQKLWPVEGQVNSSGNFLPTDAAGEAYPRILSNERGIESNYA